jgi:hypothetical protein
LEKSSKVENGRCRRFDGGRISAFDFQNIKLKPEKIDLKIDSRSKSI